MRRWADKQRCRRSGLVGIAILLAGSGVLAPAFASPVAAAATGTVKARTARMSDATLTSRQDGWYHPGDHLALVCSKRGDAVKGFRSPAIPDGGWDNLWYQTSDGHFVADVDIETGPSGVAAPACPTDPGPGTTTRLDNFVTAVAGQQIGDGQCVALIRKYLGDVYGITDAGWGDAYAYGKGGTAGNHLESRGFTWYPGEDFANGDILVWRQDSRLAGLSYGHVAIWYDGKIFDQHYNGRLTAGSDPFSDYGYEGFWRKA
ncbi:hypothetical protein [Mycobacterium sp.]|uniref:hypothetical protein n=1 Tax=Mycobacterium sp. TaxID=1785 RepID=UPI0025F8873B|nr:hypothetical protein [Mycobacterium sp.]MBW0014961.1 hypothetical protein [Mycobacterium sp.]